jgi:ubiquitin carboxyl-terminal hydrolase 5/13
MYPAHRDDIFRTSPQNPAFDFVTQMAKLGAGLVDGKYAAVRKEDGPAENDEVCVRPGSFKALVGQGHPGFSTGQQQDAAEFFQHFLQVASKNERVSSARLAPGPGTASLFDATIEERVECVESKQVRYMTTTTNVLNINIPMDEATNAPEYKEYQERKRAKVDDNKNKDGEEAPVVANVPFSACLEKLVGDTFVEDFYSSALKRNGIAKKTMRIKTFPRYLVLVMKRYDVNERWEPVKLEVEVLMPEQLDLEAYRAKGLQPDETELPEEEPGAGGQKGGAKELDMEMVSSLMMMGFSDNACKRAVRAVGSSGVEAASNWLMEHMDDADFNSPLEEQEGAAPQGGDNTVSPEAIANVAMLGFTDEQAKAALLSTNGNPERAADWLFSRMDNLDAAVAEALAAQGENAAGGGGGGAGAGAAGAGAANDAGNDGPGRYTLFGIVSHLGKNTGCGHYVAHIKKDGRWVIFNDMKVGLSKAPPLDVGYMYFYKRNE